MAGSSFTTAAAGQPEEQQGLLTKQGHGSPSFSTSRNILHHVWTLLLVLALVVVSMLYLDCSSAAKRQANEVAIQLLVLDGSTVHQRDSTSVRFTSQDQNSTANSPQRDHTLDDAMKQAAADTPHAAALAAAQLDPPDPMPPAEPADTTTPVPQLAAEPQLAATAAPPAAAAPAVVVPDLNTRTEPILPDIATRVLQLDKQQQGKRVIAMSLYGTQERYIEGAVGNAMLARRDWHGWTFRVYYGDGVPQQVLQILQAFGTELIRVNRTSERASSTLWHYLAAADPTISRFIARDIDARLSHRDKAAVDEWIDSGMFYHTMHDHAAHACCPILGGMWGSIGGFVNPALMLSLINNSTGATWGVDQDWLKDTLWPHVRKYTLDHSSYTCGLFNASDSRGFPTQREDEHDLVGNVHGPPDYRGITHSGPCPERCRRKPEWRYC